MFVILFATVSEASPAEWNVEAGVTFKVISKHRPLRAESVSIALTRIYLLLIHQLFHLPQA